MVLTSEVELAKHVQPWCFTPSLEPGRWRGVTNMISSLIQHDYHEEFAASLDD